MHWENLKILFVLIVLAILAIIAYVIYWQISMDQAEDYFNTKKYDEAEAKILSNLNTFPSFFPGRSICYKMLGEIYFDRGDMANSEKVFLSALELEETISIAHYRLGIIRNNQGNYIESMHHLEKAVLYSRSDSIYLDEIKKHFSNVAHRLGMQYYLSGQDDRAKECFDKVLKLGVEFPELDHSIGLLYSRRGNCKEALRYFEKALNDNSYLIVLYQDVIKCYKKIGVNKQANDLHKKYQELLSKEVELAEEQIIKEKE